MARRSRAGMPLSEISVATASMARSFSSRSASRNAVCRSRSASMAVRPCGCDAFGFPRFAKNCLERWQLFVPFDETRNEAEARQRLLIEPPHVLADDGGVVIDQNFRASAHHARM